MLQFSEAYPGPSAVHFSYSLYDLSNESGRLKKTFEGCIVYIIFCIQITNHSFHRVCPHSADTPAVNCLHSNEELRQPVR